MTSKVRNPAVPFIRGAAALAVLANHEFYMHTDFVGYQFGAPLFLVTSGYCIHANYKLRDDLTTWRFVWGRLRKLYPHYIAFLIFMAVVNQDALQLLLHLGFVQNLQWDQGANPMQWLWTLAVIVQLYLVYPLARRFPIEAVAGVALLTELGYRIGMNYAGLTTSVWGWPFAYTFSWALGAVLATKQKEPRKFYGFAVSLALSIVSLPIGAGCLQYTLASLAGYFVLAKVLTLRASFFENVISKIGDASYPIYLWHMPIIFLAYQHLGSSWSAVLSSCGCVILWGMILNKLIKH